MTAVAQGEANLLNALNQAVVGHHRVLPDRLHQRLFGDNAPGFRGEQSQDRKCLRAQRHFGAGSIA